jgi:PKHD-type hydroxylase
MQYQPWVLRKSGLDAQTVLQVPRNDGLTQPSGGLGFLSQTECDDLLRFGLAVPGRPAITGDGRGARVAHRRTSVVHEIYPSDDTRWIFEKLEAALTQINQQQYHFDLIGLLEGAQIYEYPSGGFLDWHRDVGMGYMSNRKISMTLQLSGGDDYEGGDLEFMDYTQKAPRGRGDLTVFPAFLMHRVTELRRGMRYSFVSWVHGPPFR